MDGSDKARTRGVKSGLDERQTDLKPGYSDSSAIIAFQRGLAWMDCSIYRERDGLDRIGLRPEGPLSEREGPRVCIATGWRCLSLSCASVPLWLNGITGTST